MNHLSSLNARVGALVHPSAHVDADTRRQHEVFVATRLLTALIATAFLPIYLAVWGVPSVPVLVAYACLMLSLLAVIVVAWTGRLGLGQAIWLVGLLGFVATLSLDAGVLTGAALVWLVLLPLEALITRNRTLLMVSCGLAALAALVVGALALSPWPQLAVSKVSVLTQLLFVVPALAYATYLVGQSLFDARQRDRVERLASARHASLSNVIGDLTMRHDRTGAVLYASRESETLFGLPPREIMGRGLFERIHVADRPAFLKTLSEAARASDTQLATLRLRTARTKTGAGAYEEPVFQWVELRARQIPHDTSSSLASSDDAVVVSLVRDVTLLKMHEQQLEDARLEAERSAAWKDRFLANVSHELRTPLNAIIGFSEMLANEKLCPTDPAKRREYADIINGSGQHLLAVVNSILDMSKIEAGRFDILPEPFRVSPLIDTCCDMMSLKAEQGQIELVRTVGDDLVELIADKRACKQILINLLSNAVKFTKPGGRVTVGVRTEGNSMAFYVADTGVGIGAQDLPRLGDAFFQARNTYDRPYEGTGLGLSVVRGLVGLHGGSICIESAPDVGTCVTVRLPLDCRMATTSLSGAVRIDTVAHTSRLQLETAFPQTGSVKKIA